MRRLCITLLILLAGCASAPRTPVAPVAVPPSKAPETVTEGEARRAKAARPTYNLTGYPPAVRDGYIDGCESAKRTSFARKDGARMESDGQYAMGWNDGFSICQSGLTPKR
jgi:hypothetical protein